MFVQAANMTEVLGQLFQHRVPPTNSPLMRRWKSGLWKSSDWKSMTRQSRSSSRRENKEKDAQNILEETPDFRDGGAGGQRYWQHAEVWGEMRTTTSAYRGSQAETGRRGWANSSEEWSETTLQQQRKLTEGEETEGRHIPHKQTRQLKHCPLSPPRSAEDSWLHLPTQHGAPQPDMRWAGPPLQEAPSALVHRKPSSDSGTVSSLRE